MILAFPVSYHCGLSSGLTAVPMACPPDQRDGWSESGVHPGPQQKESRDWLRDQKAETLLALACFLGLHIERNGTCELFLHP